MSVVSVTTTIGTTCHYWLSPEANEDIAGAGVTAPAIVHGYITENANGSSAVLTLSLDNAYAWDVVLTFLNAPPVMFTGFMPGSGGDLLTLLSAQGWVSL